MGASKSLSHCSTLPDGSAAALHDPAPHGSAPRLYEELSSKLAGAEIEVLESAVNRTEKTVWDGDRGWNGTRP